MSYILDALQRADAERERGHVPGLNSQRVPPASRKPVQARRLRPWHVLLAVAIGLCVVLALWWWQPPSVEPAPAPAAERPAAPVSETPAPAEAAIRTEPVLPILAPPRPEPVAPARTATAPAPAASSAASVPPATPVPAETASTTAVRSFAELTPEVRAQLPTVNVSGATYSKDAAVRMLIVNGKVVQEGQEIAPGLKLETIGQRSAVLNHQGLRYSIGY
ncbi:general secretion pathway protein GspB [Hydrogenophaga sp.]|jgi:general secretion pathway protein B|uniref:general secretion pathway protein GspB n=1 Tax=Hydrogenophaga sp. TaxID=1904254 RepID=UPI003F723C3D